MCYCQLRVLVGITSQQKLEIEKANLKWIKTVSGASGIYIGLDKMYSSTDILVIREQWYQLSDRDSSNDKGIWCQTQGEDRKKEKGWDK